jgi:hypothetical protein
VAAATARWTSDACILAWPLSFERCRLSERCTCAPYKSSTESVVPRFRSRHYRGLGPVLLAGPISGSNHGHWRRVELIHRGGVVRESVRFVFKKGVAAGLLSSKRLSSWHFLNVSAGLLVCAHHLGHGADDGTPRGPRRASPGTP